MWAEVFHRQPFMRTLFLSAGVGTIADDRHDPARPMLYVRNAPGETEMRTAISPPPSALPY